MNEHSIHSEPSFTLLNWCLIYIYFRPKLFSFLNRILALFPFSIFLSFLLSLLLFLLFYHLVPPFFSSSFFSATLFINFLGDSSPMETCPMQHLLSIEQWNWELIHILKGHNFQPQNFAYHTNSCNFASLTKIQSCWYCSKGDCRKSILYSINSY